MCNFRRPEVCNFQWPVTPSDSGLAEPAGRAVRARSCAAARAEPEAAGGGGLQGAVPTASRAAGEHAADGRAREWKALHGPDALLPTVRSRAGPSASPCPPRTAHPLCRGPLFSARGPARVVAQLVVVGHVHVSRAMPVMRWPLGQHRVLDAARVPVVPEQAVTRSKNFPPRPPGA